MLILLLAVVIYARPSAALQWDNSADLSDDFRLQWSIKGNEITFELQVATLGYVGIGFSATGAMDNADMAIGWVDQGQVYFQVSRSWTARMIGVDGSLKRCPGEPGRYVKNLLAN